MSGYIVRENKLPVWVTHPALETHHWGAKLQSTSGYNALESPRHLMGSAGFRTPVQLPLDLVKEKDIGVFDQKR